MTCIFCVDWDQDDPNCGHGMLDEHLVPSKWFTRIHVEALERGSLTLWHEALENGRVGRQTIEMRAAEVNPRGQWKFSA